MKFYSNKNGTFTGLSGAIYSNDQVMMLRKIFGYIEIVW